MAGPVEGIEEAESGNQPASETARKPIPASALTPENQAIFNAYNYWQENQVMVSQPHVAKLYGLSLKKFRNQIKKLKARGII